MLQSSKIMSWCYLNWWHISFYFYINIFNRMGLKSCLKNAKCKIHHTKGKQSPYLISSSVVKDMCCFGYRTRNLADNIIQSPSQTIIPIHTAWWCVLSCFQQCVKLISVCLSLSLSLLYQLSGYLHTIHYSTDNNQMARSGRFGNRKSLLKMKKKSPWLFTWLLDLKQCQFK